MKNVTADTVLRKTFEHLDQILDEKSRQIKKAVEKPNSAAPSSSKHFEHNVEEEGCGIDPTVDHAKSD